MKKTLLASSIALTLNFAAQAAFTPLVTGNYTLSITSGCFGFGNCQTSSSSKQFIDNTAAQTTFTSTALAATSRPTGFTIGSGIAGDGLMGVINFSIDILGNMTVNSFNQDSCPPSAVGATYIDALGIKWH